MSSSAKTASAKQSGGLGGLVAALAVQSHMARAVPRTDLRFLHPGRTAIAGTACDGMIVRTASRAVGRLQGFLIDSATQRVCYLVVQRWGLWGHTSLVPITAARIDIEGRAIELLDEEQANGVARFRPEQFETFSQEEPAHF